jgi:hypothetical protein
MDGGSSHFALSPSCATLGQSVNLSELLSAIYKAGLSRTAPRFSGTHWPQASTQQAGSLSCCSQGVGLTTVSLEPRASTTSDSPWLAGTLQDTVPVLLSPASSPGEGAGGLSSGTREDWLCLGAAPVPDPARRGGGGGGGAGGPGRGLGTVIRGLGPGLGVSRPRTGRDQLVKWLQLTIWKQLTGSLLPQHAPPPPGSVWEGRVEAGAWTQLSSAQLGQQDGV